MSEDFVETQDFPAFPLWEKIKGRRSLMAFELEITARCNNRCRHCYINLPAHDKKIEAKELSLDRIKGIIDKAADLGALGCVLTGGEPLLKKDFFDIYLHLKKKGLLISVFSNATLISEEAVNFFKEYPPRNIEVTVYGVTKETYEAVTRNPGSFEAFREGLARLLNNKIPVRLKAMVLRSNLHELSAISRFCQERTKDFFRFDPFLTLRYDGDAKRNAEIQSERLSPDEITAIEQACPERHAALRKNCDKLIIQDASHVACGHLLHCGAGNNAFAVSYDGIFRLCSSLWHPECICDLKKVPLAEAWLNFVPQVREIRSRRKEFLGRCHQCSLLNLCLWCPAHAYLETGAMDLPVEQFCAVAHAREALIQSDPPEGP